MQIRWQVVVLLALVNLMSSLRVNAAELASQAPAKKALAELVAWLGDSDNSKTWKEFLHTEKLQAELAKPAPDDSVLAQVEGQLASGEPGLQKRRFVALRGAIDALRAELGAQKLIAAVVDAQMLPAAAGEPTAEQKSANLKALSQASEQVNKLIGGWGAEDQDRARKHLLLDKLAQIAAGKGTTEDQQAVLARFRTYRWTDADGKDVAKVQGLEAPEFSAVRRGLRKALIFALPAESRKNLLDRAVKDLQALAAGAAVDQSPAIPEMDPLPIPAEIYLGELVEMLADAQVKHPLLDSTRNLYGATNLYVRASQKFLSAGIEEDQNRTEPVRDCILGTDIHGTANLVARSKIILLDSPEEAKYDIYLVGNVHSNTVGYNGPVTIYSTGTTSVWAKKPLTFTEFGLIGAPACVRCDTTTCINDICANKRIVENIAWKRATAAQPEAEAIASEHAEERIQPQFDQQVTESIGSVNERYDNGFREPLEIRDEAPRAFLTSTRKQNDFLSRITQASLGQLSAALPPPIATPSDMVVQVHETYVANMGRAMLGGETFTQNQQAELRKRMSLGGDDAEPKADDKPADDLPIDEDTRASLSEAELKELSLLVGRSTRITFDDRLPVRAEFGQDSAVIAVRLKSVERDAVKYKDMVDLREAKLPLIEISAAYKLAATEDGFVLERQGDVVSWVLAPGGESKSDGRLSPPEITMKRRITDRFAREAFQEKIKIPALNFKPRKGQEPPQGNWENLPPMPPTQAKAARGWFTLGWDLPAETK